MAHKTQEIEIKLMEVYSLPIAEDAKQTIRKKLTDDKSKVDLELANLTCEKAMKYNYDTKLSMLELKLDMATFTKVDFEQIKFHA